jgi:FlaA1/EpsC-like NDP-sugar epimerase
MVQAQPSTSPPGPEPAPPDVAPVAAASPKVPHQRGHSPAATLVLPYVAAPVARRTRPLRAWMLTVPVDLLAYLTPLLWNQAYWKGVIVAGLVTVGAFALGGLYAGRRHVSLLDELPTLSQRLLASAAVVAIIAAERHDSVTYVGGFLRIVAISAGLVLAGRALTRAAIIVARRRRWVEHSAIVLGGGQVATELARLLRRYPQYGLRFAGFVGADPAELEQSASMPLLGGLDDLAE